MCKNQAVREFPWASGLSNLVDLKGTSFTLGPRTEAQVHTVCVTWSIYPMETKQGLMGRTDQDPIGVMAAGVFVAQST